jgi:hypothetical protein
LEADAANDEGGRINKQLVDTYSKQDIQRQRILKADKEFVERGCLILPKDSWREAL